MPSRIGQIFERPYGLAILDRSYYYVDTAGRGEYWGYKGVLMTGEYNFKYIRAITNNSYVYKSDNYGDTWTSIGYIVE
jgi:hypothetical protein